MIEPEEFPYIKSLHVNDCYAFKDFDIVLHDYKPFSHLILTGKNGSGKSTILEAINYHLLARLGLTDGVFINTYMLNHKLDHEINQVHPRNTYNGSSTLDQIKKLKLLNSIDLTFHFTDDNFWKDNKPSILYSHQIDERKINDSTVNTVSTVTKDEDFTNKLLNNSLEKDFAIKKFKQYLVNKKVYQAFDQLNNETHKINETESFFNSLTIAFRAAFDDIKLEILFLRETFDIEFKLSDGRTVDFDMLPAGTSAFLSILMDLFLRVDLIRKQVGNFSYHPCGIVLIDEPESHLHLELQYQVLPLLIKVFPNVQFIAATHSPAVISSIKKATIYDLTTKVTETDDVAGKSYSELMVTHFGLENEYSGIADEILLKVNKVLNEFQDSPQLKNKLQIIFDENKDYLSPSLKIELELLIAQQEAKAAVQQ